MYYFVTEVKMKATFNSKYDNYVQELPPFILKRIETKISKKYPLDAQNTDIDQIFEKQQCSYQKKKEYDAKYFQRQSHSELHGEHEKLKNELDQLKIELNVLRNENKSYKEAVGRIEKQRDEYKHKLDVFMKEITAGNIKRVDKRRMW